jgi:hypothetical protein
VETTWSLAPSRFPADGARPASLDRPAGRTEPPSRHRGGGVRRRRTAALPRRPGTGGATGWVRAAGSCPRFGSLPRERLGASATRNQPPKPPRPPHPGRGQVPPTLLKLVNLGQDLPHRLARLGAVGGIEPVGHRPGLGSQTVAEVGGLLSAGFWPCRPGMGLGEGKGPAVLGHLEGHIRPQRDAVPAGLRSPEPPGLVPSPQPGRGPPPARRTRILTRSTFCCAWQGKVERVGLGAAKSPSARPFVA